VAVPGLRSLFFSSSDRVCVSRATHLETFLPRLSIWGLWGWAKVYWYNVDEEAEEVS
jgi:hypothetical protein